MICGHCSGFRTAAVVDMTVHWRTCGSDGRWLRVAELRGGGHHDAAVRLARRILGVQGPPMADDDRERLREYKETHKEEIRERRLRQTLIRRRTLEVLAAGPRRAHEGSGKERRPLVLGCRG